MFQIFHRCADLVEADVVLALEADVLLALLLIFNDKVSLSKKIYMKTRFDFNLKLYAF